jgi:hypothetical protein
MKMAQKDVHVRDSLGAKITVCLCWYGVLA